MKALRSLALCALVAACNATGQPSKSPPPAPGPSPTQLDATHHTVTPVPSASPAQLTDRLSGGRYLFGPFSGVTVAATGPDGWVGYRPWAMDGPDPIRADAPTGIGITFFTAGGLYSDPCHWDVQGTGRADVGDVKVGPSVGDLVAGLRTNTFYTSSTPTPITIDGYHGQELELQLPGEPRYTMCDKEPGDATGHPFVFAGPGLYSQGPSNRWDLSLLDVDGTRLIAVVLFYEGTPKADLDLARTIIATIDINP